MILVIIFMIFSGIGLWLLGLFLQALPVILNIAGLAIALFFMGLYRFFKEVLGVIRNSDYKEEMAYSDDSIRSDPANSYGSDWCSLCQRSHNINEKEEVTNSDDLKWCNRCNSSHSPQYDCTD